VDLAAAVLFRHCDSGYRPGLEPGQPAVAGLRRAVCGDEPSVAEAGGVAQVHVVVAADELKQHLHRPQVPLPAVTDGQGERQGALASRTVVFIPDIPYGLRNDIQITKPLGPDARSLLARQLGFQDDGLASQVIGTIEGAPVFASSALEGRVLAVDLGRFGDLLRPVRGGAQSPDLELDLLEPADPLRPSAPSASGVSPAGGPQIKPLEVQLVLSLPTEIEVKDASAAHVIKFELPASDHPIVGLIEVY
jgi:hypothetical protein